MLDAITSFTGKYSFLSNFSHSRVKYEGQDYPTVEHAFQAAKSTDLSFRNKIRKVTAGQTKRLGRKAKLRPDWESVKFKIMEELLRKKFSNKVLKEYLLETQGQEIIEGNHWG